ncbi:hypothetical protein GWK48_07595 [Metallosphaera tengchongensis]|uniref:Uncharacterized protein n=1 Tax=Metallosphaera tengchongensis TaxID=1532350 RepID=A0A6N0NVL4_9CREN|nr:hypothetical protein [Metallosphaera tengchongensis]QKR00257.1 hypothetical protein GWK48_07595 [Metallosphaera tengchongensis]
MEFTDKIQEKDLAKTFEYISKYLDNDAINIRYEKYNDVRSKALSTAGGFVNLIVPIIDPLPRSIPQIGLKKNT